MKKIYFLLFILALFALPVFVHAEVIRDFSVEITVNRDASLDVSESITYDFENEQKHGIYRDIPVKYEARGGNYNLRLSDITVTDENGAPYSFTISNQGQNKEIKIGEANKLITGEHIYIINYRVKRAINFFNDHDELYWNATGNDWQVNIEQAKAVINLPARTLESDLETDCYTGKYGVKDPCLSKRYIYSAKDTVEAVAFTNDRLKAGEGMTVAVGWPVGLVTKPRGSEEIIETIKDNSILFLPVFTLMILFYLWHTRGRDPKGRGTIIAQFEPPDNLSPAELGTIIDERADKQDISAEIINLAVRGYLKIKRLEGKGILKKDDYEIARLKAGDENIAPHERKLIGALFGNKDTIKLSDLKEKFYKDLEEIKKDIYSATVRKGYFPSSPRKIQGIYLGIGIAIAAVGAFLGSALGGFGVLSFIASGVIVIIFSFFMPVKTRAGVIAREHILGLKEYLRVAEKDRIEFHNAPEKNPEIFEKLLPFAMVLGVEKQWAKQFEGIYNREPAWYSDSSRRPFTAYALASNLGSFQSKANTTLTSRPASSGGSGLGGGGFSGGGFGGGGGGSW